MTFKIVIIHKKNIGNYFVRNMLGHFYDIKFTLDLCQHVNRIYWYRLTVDQSTYIRDTWRDIKRILVNKALLHDNH